MALFREVTHWANWYHTSGNSLPYKKIVAMNNSWSFKTVIFGVTQFQPLRTSRSVHTEHKKKKFGDKADKK